MHVYEIKGNWHCPDCVPNQDGAIGTQLAPTVVVSSYAEHCHECGRFLQNALEGAERFQEHVRSYLNLKSQRFGHEITGIPGTILAYAKFYNIKPHYIYNDGGRAEAGYKGDAGDCGVRATCIATGQSYRKTYNEINRAAKNVDSSSRSRTGISTYLLNKYLKCFGFEMTKSPFNTRVSNSLFKTGTFIIHTSHHYIACINGVFYDTHDGTKQGRANVLDYWELCPLDL